MPVITLLTDFGTADGYIAAMKGVIASIAPEARVEDAGHDIAPGDVGGAAFALLRYALLYPPGTVHVIVVDPDVGTDRRGLVVEVGGRFLVGPDNGVFSHVLRGAEHVRVFALENSEYFREKVSPTFHGRDVFAPVAAHIANDVAPEEFGTEVTDPVQLEWPEPAQNGGEIGGVVMHADRYGNLITSIASDLAPSGSAVRVGELIVGRVQRTYADVGDGEVVPLIGSLGLLEISVRGGNAAELLRASVGSPVWVQSSVESAAT